MLHVTPFTFTHTVYHSAASQLTAQLIQWTGEPLGHRGSPECHRRRGRQAGRIHSAAKSRKPLWLLQAHIYTHARYTRHQNIHILRVYHIKIIRHLLSPSIKTFKCPSLFHRAQGDVFKCVFVLSDKQSKTQRYWVADDEDEKLQPESVWPFCLIN